MSRTSLIAIILGVGLLAAAGYLLFRPSTTGGVVTSDAPASAAELTFISLTAKLDPVAFDTSILQDPRFMQLTDIRTIIIPEPSSRPDPFSPLPGVK